MHPILDLVNLRFLMIASSVVQLIPCVDVIGSVLCYMMFRKEGQTDVT